MKSVSSFGVLPHPSKFIAHNQKTTDNIPYVNPYEKSNNSDTFGSLSDSLSFKSDVNFSINNASFQMNMTNNESIIDLDQIQQTDTDSELSDSQDIEDVSLQIQMKEVNEIVPQKIKGISLLENHSVFKSDENEKVQSILLDDIEDELSLKYKNLSSKRMNHFEMIYYWMLNKYIETDVFGFMVRQQIIKKSNFFKMLHYKQKTIDSFSVFDFLFEIKDQKETDIEPDESFDFYKFTLESLLFNKNIIQNQTDHSIVEAQLDYYNMIHNVTLKRRAILDSNDPKHLKCMNYLYDYWDKYKLKKNFYKQWSEQILCIIDSDSHTYLGINEWFNCSCLQMLNVFMEFCPYTYFSTICPIVNNQDKTIQLMYISLEERLGQSVNEKLEEKKDQYEGNWDFQKKCVWMEKVMFHSLFMLKMAQNVMEFIHFNWTPDSTRYVKLDPYSIEYKDDDDCCYVFDDQKYVFYVCDFQESFVQIDDEMFTGMNPVRKKIKANNVNHIDLFQWVKSFLLKYDPVWIDQYVEYYSTISGKSFIEENVFCKIIESVLSCDTEAINLQQYNQSIEILSKKYKIPESYIVFYASVLENQLNNEQSISNQVVHQKSSSLKSIINDTIDSIDLSSSCKKSFIDTIMKTHFKKYKSIKPIK